MCIDVVRDDDDRLIWLSITDQRTEFLHPVVTLLEDNDEWVFNICLLREDVRHVVDVQSGRVDDLVRAFQYLALREDTLDVAALYEDDLVVVDAGNNFLHFRCCPIVYDEFMSPRPNTITTDGWIMEISNMVKHNDLQKQDDRFGILLLYPSIRR